MTYCGVDLIVVQVFCCELREVDFVKKDGGYFGADYVLASVDN